MDDCRVERDNVIGGELCHLCGAVKKYEAEWSGRSFKKNGCFKTKKAYNDKTIEYYCGTSVNFHNGEPKVYQGEKCLK